MSYRRHVYVVMVRVNIEGVRRTWDFRGVYGTLERAQEIGGGATWESDGGTYIADSENGTYTWSIERVEVR